MSIDGIDDHFIEELLNRAAKLFREYGYSEPEKLLIRPRKLTNPQPHSSTSDHTMYLVSTEKEEDYYSQVCWVLAKIRAGDHESYFARRASGLELILEVGLVLDVLIVLSLPISWTYPMVFSPMYCFSHYI